MRLPKTFLATLLFLVTACTTGRDAAGAAETREVVFPKKPCLGRVMMMNPGWDFIREEKLQGKFIGPAAGVLTVPRDAKLWLDMDSRLGSYPAEMRGLTCNEFEALRLRYCETNPEMVKFFLPMSKLRRLELFDCEFTDKDLRPLGSMRNLEHLTLRNIGLNGDCYKELQNLKKLHYLNASSNTLKREAFTYIAKLPDLNYLDLARTGLTDDALIEIAGSGKLIELNVNYNAGVTSRSLPALKANHNLRSVRFGFTSVNPHDALILKGLPLKFITFTHKIMDGDLRELHRVFPDTKIVISGGQPGETEQILFAPTH